MPDDLGDALVRNTIRLALVCYFAALLLMLRLRGADWTAASSRGRAARGFWTLACGVYLVHVACAFQVVHHWSHAEAFEHVRKESGVGEGIFVSYLFTAVWIADVLFWWLAPASYAMRSLWIDRLLHGFLLFIVFNGTVVYEDGPIRWISAGAFAVLAVLWRQRVRGRRSMAEDRPTMTPGEPGAI